MTRWSPSHSTGPPPTPPRREPSRRSARNCRSRPRRPWPGSPRAVQRTRRTAADHERARRRVAPQPRGAGVPGLVRLARTAHDAYGPAMIDAVTAGKRPAQRWRSWPRSNRSSGTRQQRLRTVEAAASWLGALGSIEAVLPLEEAAKRHGGAIESSARRSIREIQARLAGSPGRLTLAGTDAGTLSLATDTDGRASLPPTRTKRIVRRTGPVRPPKRGSAAPARVGRDRGHQHVRRDHGRGADGQAVPDPQERRARLHPAQRALAACRSRSSRRCAGRDPAQRVKHDLRRFRRTASPRKVRMSVRILSHSWICRPWRSKRRADAQRVPARRCPPARARARSARPRSGSCAARSAPGTSASETAIV